MCGIIAVIHADTSSTSAAADIHDALYLQQHRGQDACGIATCAAGGRIYQCKGNGMASKVFHDGDRVSDLPGFMGVGHLRYPTAGSSANAEAQPFYVNFPYGICFTHNGNLINATKLKQFLDQEAHRHINTESDSEIMLNIFANELHENGKARVNAEDCFAALKRTYDRCQGGWACTAMLAGFGLLAMRDPHGIRPLCIGSRTVDGATDYMLASESVALQYFGCTPEDIRDVLPGEAVIIQKGQKPQFRQVHQQLAYAPDIFEYVYFARPDSMIDGISVYECRRNMGTKLAVEIARKLSPEDVSEIDTVIPIPETANTAARCVAKQLGKELVDGFIKNRYIFRTFIMPTQRHRQTGVRRKLSAMPSLFKGKNVLLVDDSIVRGTTCREIVQMARDAGARKVFFASCAPPITDQHIYGIDLASRHELIASNKATHKINEAVAREIHADAVIYQTLPDLQKACAELSPRANQQFEVGVFSGQYITPVEVGYLDHLEQVRGETKMAKVKERARAAVASGRAGEEDVRLVVGESAENSDGASADGDGAAESGVNGTREGHRAKRVKRTSTWPAAEERGHVARPANSQDISLDNLNDHER